MSKKEKEDRNNIEKNRLHFIIYQKKKKKHGSFYFKILAQIT